MIDKKGRKSSLVWERGAEPLNVQDLLQGYICATWLHNKSIQPSQAKAQSHSQQINKETKRQGHNPHDINAESAHWHTV